MLGRVTAVRWYPVKSMQGEDLTGSLFTERGIPGDRHWGVADTATGVVLSAKRADHDCCRRSSRSPKARS